MAEKKSIEIVFSDQAEMMIRNMSDVKQEDVLDWFINVRKISIGGGDIVSYLQYLEGKNKVKQE